MTEQVSEHRVASAHMLAIAMIVLLLASFVVGTGFLIWRGYVDNNERTAQLADSTSQVVAANAEWILQTARQVLLRVDDALDANLTPPSPEVVAGLDQAVGALPGGARIYVVAEDGSTRLTTDPDFRAIDIRDREYFQGPANGATWFVSGLLVSRLNDEQIFVVSHRLVRNGAFAGVAVVSFNSNLMRRIWQSLALDAKSTVTLLRDDGMLVTRFPQPAGPLNLAASPIFEGLKTADSGTYEGNSIADNVRRVVAYRRIPGSNLIAVGSISPQANLDRYARGVALALGLVTPVALALAAMAWWLERLLRADARRREELSRALEANQMLFREIHHRVKNNLQAVNSLVSLQPMPAEVKADMTRRIAAMVAVHEHIYRNDQFIEVDASRYLPVIVDNLVGSYGRAVAVHYDLDPLSIDREHAMPIGLIVNEVVSNAFKYAFGEERDGELHVTLKRQEGNRALLTIADNGPGFDPADVRRGMGSRLIAGLSGQLQAEFSYERKDGMVFRLDFPLEGR